jgi:hypothetical protein
LTRIRTSTLVVIAVALLLIALGLRANNDDGGGGGGSSADSPASGDSSAPAGLSQAGFWQLTSDTRATADNDTGTQSDLLEERLSKLPPREIVQFQQIRHRLDERAYTWDLWGAAFVIEDGCSDDCFRDFRAYLISLGPRVYAAALRNPDSLAGVVEDAEEGDWENADSVAGDAYENATGEDLPVSDSDLSGEPRGQPWDDGDQELLVQRYPRLAERFR